MARRRKDTMEELRELHPKLRMVLNGSAVVNAIRAEFASALYVPSETARKKIKQQRTDATAPIDQRELPRSARRGHLKEPARSVVANVFVELTSVELDPDSVVPSNVGSRGQIAAARVPLAGLPALAKHKCVAYVEPAEPLVDPTPVVSTDKVRAPAPRRIDHAQLHHHGEGVLIGIIDVQGFDFSHPDFLDDQGRTRFARIWDQGGSTRPSPTARRPGNKAFSRFDFGAELRKDELDRALRRAPDIGAPPWDLEAQSQQVAGSHGTHVASIAAGNRGLCSKSVIAGVLVSMPDEDLDRRKSFYDSTRIVHAVEYLLALREELNLEAVSINISLGTNGHAHDGSSAASRWIDSALSVPRRAVCVAAGNAGQEKAEFEGDIGYVMGRIHTSGKIESAGLVHDIDWVVVGNGTADISENELEIWYGAQDRFAVSIRPPGGDWIGPIEPAEFIENRKLDDGTFLSVYNELYYPANGANSIAVYLSPFMTEAGVVGVKAGRWTVRIHGLEVRDGRYHGWIERDDPRPVGRFGSQNLWRFPSYFSERSNVDQSSISSLACGQNVIAVANLDVARAKINISSSQGPTRDGRFKPDVAAHGTDVVAARGFHGGDDPWIKMTGTSMASPYVAGVVGLMLAANPRLTGSQIIGILHRTSRPLPGASYEWRNDAGFGQIDPEACILEARRVATRKDRT